MLSIEHISFAEDEVHLRGKFSHLSPRLVTTIVYSNRYWPRRENKTFDAEYQLTRLAYIFDVVARLDTASVELKYTLVEAPLSNITLADDQAISDDVKLGIIEGVGRFPQLSSYIATNCNRTFRHFIDGMLLRGM